MVLLLRGNIIYIPPPQEFITEFPHENAWDGIPRSSGLVIQYHSS
jgi:hypothetical protein